MRFSSIVATAILAITVAATPVHRVNGREIVYEHRVVNKYVHRKPDGSYATSTCDDPANAAPTPGSHHSYGSHGGRKGRGRGRRPGHGGMPDSEDSDPSEEYPGSWPAMPDHGDSYRSPSRGGDGYDSPSQGGDSYKSPSKGDDGYGGDAPSGNVNIDGILSAGFQEQCLSAHNALRAAHGARPLRWDSDLESRARSNVAQCQMRHDVGGDNKDGQNLAMGTAGAYSALSHIMSWYNEGYQGGANHYTQVVWAGATAIGCAQQTCGRETYLACNYDKGNMGGEYDSNVLPLKDSSVPDALNKLAQGGSGSGSGDSGDSGMPSSGGRYFRRVRHAPMFEDMF